MRGTSSQALPVLACGALAVPIVLAIASYGMKAVYATAGIAVAVLICYLLRSDIWTAIRSVQLRKSRDSAQPAPRALRPVPAPTARSRRGRRLGLFLVASSGAGMAWLAAAMGTKAMVAAVGAVAALCLLLFVKDRTVFFSYAAVASLTFTLHKSIGPQNLGISGGPPSVYISSFDLMVVLLYGLWISEGTFARDVRAAARRRLVWLPLATAGLLLPSLLVVADLNLAAGELTRMFWSYLLYAYLAIRVQTRRHVWAVLAGLATFAAVELVVVILQWQTGGVLGLDFLGVPTTLTARTTDTTVLGRPFGTLVHPVFMAAALGMIAMVAYAVALELQRSLTKFVALGVTAGSLACMWISHTRASFVAVVMAGAVVTLVALIRGRLRWRSLGIAALLALIGVAAFWSRIREKLAENFGTGHFWTEVDSRLELNEVALRMIADRPMLGAGLNNFEILLPRYEANPVIFFGHPVHNLYLLYLAETGLIGLTGVLVIGVVLYRQAILLGRSRDRLLAGVGVGIAGAMGFVMVEELLGFSLRHDAPRGLYWMLAGLAVAGLRMSGDHPSQPASARRLEPAPRPRTAATAGAGPARRARPVGAALSLVLIGAAVLVAPATVEPTPAAAAIPSDLLIFQGKNRLTDEPAIYTVRGDGTDMRKVSPSDGRAYSWPRWAFGNTKIIYTVRTGAAGGPEDIEMMNPDGTGRQLLQSFDYRVGQPLVDPTGRYVHYTGMYPGFPKAAQFRLDLVTGLSSNLTAVTQRSGGFDADPFLNRRGTRLTFVDNAAGRGAQIVEMKPDGTDRKNITNADYFNTDPSVSPDDSQVAIASYRGYGKPETGGELANGSTIRPEYWHIVVQSRRTGREKVLTGGANCVIRKSFEPCTVTEMSGFVPRFHPDGNAVSFTGALDQRTNCICSIGVDGKDPRVIFARTDVSIGWHDWPQPPGYSTDTGSIGTGVSRDKLLLTTIGADGKSRIFEANLDLSKKTELTLPADLEPLEARWGADRKTVVFTARVAVGPRQSPHPAPPPGQVRRAHVTLTDINPVAVNQRASGTQKSAKDVMSQQVFLRAPDGRVRQLTDPWIEDWRDGLAEGDARGNSDPRMSSDGRYVVVKNTSTTTGESFLLRIHLVTGEVVNLTNGTSGAVATDDAEPAYSPGDRWLAFSWTGDGARGIYLMDADTGGTVTGVTAISDQARSPAWSPDGSFLAYVREKPDSSTVVRANLTADHEAASTRVISDGISKARAPVISPDGGQIAFLAPLGNVLSLYVADASGRGAAQPVQPDLTSSLISIDWK